ncbi:hypothetical protein TWF730_006736 [Orbilia blumenaviensis]|uniref:F-box domain-containing protein n=1 Tax=Orbilia blumenaviensis TaxID=1796055 RepID=A0AAV9VGC3_9PEZI
MLPYLPLELHLQILSHAHWSSYPSLSLVCKSWRYFLKNSPLVQRNKYADLRLIEDFMRLPTPPPVPVHFPDRCFHRIITFLTHFIRFRGKLYPCNIDFERCHISLLRPPPPLHNSSSGSGGGGEVEVGVGITPKPPFTISIFDTSFFSKDMLLLPSQNEIPIINSDNSYIWFSSHLSPDANPTSILVPQSETPTVQEFLESMSRDLLVGKEDWVRDFHSASTLEIRPSYTNTKFDKGHEIFLCFLVYCADPEVLTDFAENVHGRYTSIFVED